MVVAVCGSLRKIFGLRGIAWGAIVFALCSRSLPFAVVLCCSLLPSNASAVDLGDKSGVSPSRLRLPKGPGSLEGIGENVEPNLAMGLSTYAVPIQVPAGYELATPALRLTYSSGAGNSELGIGWSLAFPSIERMTSKGLPKYQASDTFVADGSSELVRVNNEQNIYRVRFEGGFARYTWIDSAKTGQEGYWKAEYPDGRVGYFGADSSGTIEPNAREQGPNGTFRYHVVDVVDPLDHVLKYEYTKDGAFCLLKRIAYVFQKDGTREPRYQVLFAYEERPDQISDAKPGFELRLSQRLVSIRVFVRGVQLRRYQLSYRPTTDRTFLSRLERVQQYGVEDVDPYPIDFRFEYTGESSVPCSGSGCDSPQTVNVPTKLDLDFASHSAELIDINGDSLPDVLDTSQAKHRFFVNEPDAQGHATYPTAAQSTYGSMQLNTPYVQTVDLDGNGYTDLIDSATGSGSARVLWNRGDGDWSNDAVVTASGLPDFSEFQNLRFLDYDNDKKIDLLFNDGSNAFVYENQGGLKFVANTNVEPLGVAFTNLELADMNGDGMLDAVELGTDMVAYKLNLGRGKWSDWIEMQNVPRLESGELRVTDVNGDGLSDTVKVLGDQIQYWLNHSGRSYGDQVTVPVTAVPAGTSLRFADMNGNGSADVVWITPSGAVSYQEFFQVRPNLLSRVTTGAGKVIELSYGSSVTQMAKAKAAGQPWVYRLPHTTTVLESMSTYDTASMLRQTRHFEYRDGYYDGMEKQFRGFETVTVTSEGDNDTVQVGVTQHQFDIGRTDVYKKALLTKQVIASASQTLREVANTFEDCTVGDIADTPSPAVRFVCQTSSKTTIEEGLDSTKWVTLLEQYQYDAYGNRTQTAKQGVTAIGDQGCPESSRSPEVFGAPSGPNCLGDESIEQTQFVPPTATSGRWMLNKPAWKRAYGRDQSTIYSETIHHYDGEAFVGLATGQLTRGLLTRTEARVDAQTLVNSQSTQYDANGSPLEVRDPNGRARRFTYDDDGILLLSEEIVFDQQVPPYSLLMTASYDNVHDAVTEASSWMRVEGGAPKSAPSSTQYSYDEFGRLASIARAGDSLTAPTETFTYDLGNPVSRIIRSARSQRGGSLDVEEVRCFDGLGREFETRARIEGSRYQVTGHKNFDVQGNPLDSYQSFIGERGNCDPVAPSDVPFTRTRRDATQRVLSITHPDSDLYGSQSVSSNRYEPLRTISSDVEDNDPKSAHFDTPEITTLDGLGRTTGIDRYLTRDQVTHLEVTYDELGHLRGYVDAQGNQKTQTFDWLGRVIRVDDPDSHATTFTYDAAGNVLSEVDARGVTKSSTYDEANRLLQQWQEDHETTTRISYTHDRVTGCADCGNVEGRLAAVTYPLSADGTVLGQDAFGYDARGQHVFTRRTFDGHAFALTTELDNLGRVIGRRYPTGTRIARSLDSVGRLVSVPGYIPSITYEARGLPSTLSLGNGVTTTYSYDSLARLNTLQTVSPAGRWLQSYTYQRDRIGNITDILDASDSEQAPSANAHYLYDDAYRLTSAQLDVGRPAEEEQSFTYDALDNITSKTSGAGSKSPDHVGAYTYGEAGAGPHAVTTAGDMSLRYDAAGNTTLRGQDSYEWDFMGRMSSAKRGNRVLGVYAYGTDLDRVKKEEDGHVTYYIAPDFEVRDGTAIIYVAIGERKVAKVEYPEYALELLGDTAPGISSDSAFTTNADGQTTAGDAWIAHGLAQGFFTSTSNLPDQAPEQLLAASARRTSWCTDSRVTYLHHDHLSSVVGATDSAGELLYSEEHYPYGATRYESGSRIDEYSFTGKERDLGTALQYFGARYFDGHLARWTAPDASHARWLKPTSESQRTQDADSHGLVESLNRYGYVAENPIAHADPDGMKIVFDSSCSTKFRREFLATVAYLKAHNAEGVLADVHRSSKIVRIYDGSKKRVENYKNTYNRATRAVTIDLNLALLSEDGTRTSPAVILVHEMAHARHHIENRKEYLAFRRTKLTSAELGRYDNLEEHRTIRDEEAAAARLLNEGVRSGHAGGSLYPVLLPWMR